MKKEITPLIIGSIVVFTLFALIILKLNIHGDAKFHTLYAKDSTESGFLVAEQPRRIFMFEGNRRIYMPIAYPLTSEALFSVLYLFGGELLLKIYAPLFATLIFLVLSLTFKEIGMIQSNLLSIFATMAISERLIMTPLIEPYLLLLTLSGIYTLKRYFQSSKVQWLYLSALFLGTSAAVKQQGLLYLLFILAFTFIVEVIYKTIREKKSFLPQLLRYVIFLVICVTIPIPAIYNQFQRTGTFAYAPGTTEIPKSTPFYNALQPILSSSYTPNKEAALALEQTVTYNKGNKTLLDKGKGFFLSPFLYYRSINKGFQSLLYIQLFIISVFVIFLSFLIKSEFVKNNPLFSALLVSSVFAEIGSSTLLKTPITQYHVLGVVISTILIFLSIILLAKKFNGSGIALFGTLFTFFIIGYIHYIYPLWLDNSREDSYHIEGYKRIGDFIQKNTSSDAIFLASGTSFRYYVNRDSVWLNEGIGHLVKKVISTSNDKEAVNILNELHTDYVVINKDQINRVGVNDYLPPDGLISMINKSQNFSAIYDPYGDGEMIVYKVERESK